MERSRSKRYYYSHEEYNDSEMLPRTRQRYQSQSHSQSHASHHYHGKDYHRRSVGRKSFDSTVMVTTTFKILCHDARAGGVIGKSGSIINAIRQHTGARINVHDLVPGDHEHVIEISDTRRRDPDGRMPAFSPSQEALLLIHEKILECHTGSSERGCNETVSEDEEYESRRGGGNHHSNNNHNNNYANQVVTRLIVSRVHVGCLLGRGGKIIEQMRIKSKAHIRVLTRDQILPRCVATSEEIVQVAGDVDAVKDAIDIISSRLRESQHRDRSHFRGWQYSTRQFIPGINDFVPQRNKKRSSASMDISTFEPRLSTHLAGNKSAYLSSQSSDYAIESSKAPFTENLDFYYGELVFRILCPVNKINVVVGDSNGIMELLQNEIGVDVKVADHIAGTDEQIIIISSVEGPDNELFPAQEALLHIQTRIVDLVPEKENIITTRLLVQSDEVGYLGGRDGLSCEMRKINGANVQILPKEELPAVASESDEILQIVGEIKAAREALIEVTTMLRSFAYGEIIQEETPQLPESAPSPTRSDKRPEANSGHNIIGNDSPQNSPDDQKSHPGKIHSFDLNFSAGVEGLDCDLDTCASSGGVMKQNENESFERARNDLNKVFVPLVNRRTLEVSIPPHAATKLITKSRNRLVQISELSGTNVKLIEDRPEETEKMIQISGTPEQIERARSLLQGFILSIEEDNS